MTSVFSLFPASASIQAPGVDHITLALCVLCGAMVILIFSLIAFFSIYYRKGSPRSRKLNSSSGLVLEWGWTFATLGIFLGIFSWGAFVYFDMHIAPANASEVFVVGKQWMWKFQHADGKRELNELHIPIGQPILLALTSQDVIHSFFVPAFRIKQDALPGRYTYTWFQASQTGEYYLFCTQYCGTMHAEMRGKVIVMSPEDYSIWSRTGLTSPPIQQRSSASRGAELFEKLACVQCHREGSTIHAPRLEGIYGKPVLLTDGQSVTADENYLRESIVNPQAKIVQGYESIMPSYSGLASELDIIDLISYIRSLEGKAHE